MAQDAPPVCTPEFSPDAATLRSAISLISQFVSESILDPHWGFQATFSGAGQYAENQQELCKLLQQLIETLDIVGFGEQRTQLLEQRLRAESLPSLAVLREHLASQQTGDSTSA